MVKGYDTAQARSRVGGPVYRDELRKAERGEAAIRRKRLWAESPDAQRASSKSRKSIAKMQLERLRI